MTSAALAVCHGARQDSASKNRAKLTVFMRQSSDFSGERKGVVTNYRPRMNDLRRRAFALQQSRGSATPACLALRYDYSCRYPERTLASENVRRQEMPVKRRSR